VIAFSPHAWGWTEPSALLLRLPLVFPTRVGVDRWVPDGWPT